MKQKRLLIFALVLLLAGIGFMFWDLFLRKPSFQGNPYEYDLSSLKAGDTTLVQYAEVQQIRPGMDTVSGVATDRSGKIYIAGKNLVKIFLPDGNEAGSFPVEGMASCIDVDSTGMIIFGLSDHLGVYNPGGRKIRTWACPAEDAIITSVAANKTGIYAADAGNRIVYRFDHSGNLLNNIGDKDPQKNIPGFVIPSPYFDLAINFRNDLWVVNPGRHSFEKYSPEGDLLSTWGKASMATEGFCGCCNPSHFAFLPDGSFVTSEKGIERIKIYSPEGKFISLVASPESFTEGTRGLDLAVDPKGRIIVLDPERNIIRIFTIKPR